MKVIEGDAKTRILWGEQPSVVIGYLSNNGYSVKRAEELVSGFLELRYRIVRRRGVLRMVLGGPLFVFLFWILATSVPVENPADAFAGSGGPEGLACTLIGLFFGLWKLIDGLRDFFLPSLAKGDLGFHGEEM